MKLNCSAKIVIICVLLTIVTGAVYWQLTGSKFVIYDDPVFVTENQHINGLTYKNILWAVTGTVNGNWQPAIWLTYMLDYQLFGLDPGAFHFTNLILHIANALLLLILLHRMTGSLWKSAFVAAIFALHPLHVESVAWISERKDVLSTLFWLLTTLAYIRYAEKPNLRRYALVLIVFALGLMAKPMLVTLPIILLLLDYWPLGRLKAKAHTCDDTKPVPLKKLVLEKVPPAILALGAVIITLVTQISVGATSEMGKCGFGVKAANAIVCYFAYIRKMIWPCDLAIFYPHPLDTLPQWLVVSCGVALVAITYILVRSRKRPYALVGWLWYLITLLPVIGFVQVGLQAMADRYTYVPMIGIAIMIAWSVPETLLKVWRGRALVAFIALTIITALTVCTYRQVSYWHDDFTLLNRAIEIVPKNSLANGLLGSAYYKAGNEDAAEQYFREALRALPRYYIIRHNLASLLVKQKRLDEAAECLEETLHFYPNDAYTHLQIGTLYLMQSKLDLAEEHLRKVIRLYPSKPRAHGFLGIVFVKKGKLDVAIDQLSRAVEISPKNKIFVRWLDYARSLQAQNKLDKEK
ncbi:tetratricopeptide repeat protein [bacterium]|nr:tetratricopeptide repeat protein [bacterium]